MEQHRGKQKTDFSKPKPPNICPFSVIKNYLAVRSRAITKKEQFFVFSDSSPVTPQATNWVLKQIITLTGLDANLYSFHSLRIGRATDLLRMGCSVETIKKIGRWKSNAGFRYLC